MKKLKTYELFNGGRITTALKKDIRNYQRKLTPFMIAITDGDMKRFNKLIDIVDLEQEDNKGNTALLMASYCGRLKMLKELIKKGANIHHKNDKGEDFYDMAEFQYKFINNTKKWIEKNYPEFIAAKKYNL